MSVGRWSASISLFPSPSGDFFFFVLIIWNAVSPDLMTLLHRNGVFSSMTEPRSQTVVITMSTAFLSVYVYVSSVCIELLLVI